MTEAPEIIAALRAANSQAVELAKVVSLAAIVEPGLLRKARVELLPRADAGAEADLWFSPLVESQSTRGLVLLPAVAESLRQELAVESPLLEKSWRLIKEFHASSHPTIQLEERLTRLSLAGGDEESFESPSEEIQRLLRQALAAMASGRNAEGVARWALRALPRLPEEVRTSEPAWMLSVAAGAHLGGRTILDVETPPNVSWEELSWLIPTNSQRVAVGVRLFERAAEFSYPPAGEAEQFHVPKTSPVLLEVREPDAPSPRVTTLSLQFDQVKLVPLSAGRVEIQTSSGEVFALTRRAGERRRHVSIHCVYDRKVKNVGLQMMKHLRDLEVEGTIISWYNRELSGVKEFNSYLNEHLTTADIILPLVSPDFLAAKSPNSFLMKRALEKHEAGYARVIPIVGSDVDWKGIMQDLPFHALQIVPKVGSLISSQKIRDEAFAEIVRMLRQVISELKPRDAEPAPSTTRPSLIPRPPSVGFVARRDEQGRDYVEWLTEMLSPPESQVVSLWGPGGAGKTTLAAEAVRKLSSVYGNRFVWMSVSNREHFTLSSALDDVASQLGREDLSRLAPREKRRRSPQPSTKLPRSSCSMTSKSSSRRSRVAAWISSWVAPAAPCSSPRGSI